MRARMTLRRGATTAALCATLTALVLLGSPGLLGATVVVRGPYLQKATDWSIVIRWRTDLAATSEVRYGTSPAALTASFSNALFTTEHEIEITDLEADTRYYYTVGAIGEPLTPAGSDYSFKTSPMPGTDRRTRVWIIGDSGTANASAAAVRDAFRNYPGGDPADVWLMLGDNAYNTGTDLEYQAAVFNMYPTILRNTPLWPTRGNHDFVHAGSWNDYYDIFTMPVNGEAGGLASASEAYYSYDFGDVHFVCLDSEGSARTPGSPMLTWLAADLEATDRRWIVAYWHHPPYTKGSHDSDNVADSGGRMRDMRENVLPILDVEMGVAGSAHLAVFDASGRLVADLLQGELEAGPRAVQWNGRDAAGRLVPPGVYYAALEALGERRVRKITWIR